MWKWGCLPAAEQSCGVRQTTNDATRTAADYAWLPQHKTLPSTFRLFVWPTSTRRRIVQRPMRQKYLCPMSATHLGYAETRWRDHWTYSAAPSRRNNRPNITCAVARHWQDHCRTIPQFSTPTMETIRCAWDTHVREAPGHRVVNCHCASGSPRYRERVPAVDHTAVVVRQITQTE